MPIEDFWPAVIDCLGLGIGPPGILEGLSVRTHAGGVSLSLPTTENVELTLMDASGKAVLRRRWNGEALWIGDLSNGAYLLELVQGDQRSARKLYIP